MATLGQYELVRELGEGGMATVYEAVDQRIGRTVALKVLTLPFYLSQTQRQVLIARLMREARAAGRLSHPNIVTIYDVGEQDGHHYIAMEYLQGGSLRSLLEDGPVTYREAADILAQVAAGLDHAHAQGVLHRDIKPSNVMLLPDGRVKLADFGVARQVDDAKLTQTGVPVGSPAYMAPEQVRGEAVTAASDRWSLGVLLYEMLAGRPPFTSESIPAVLHQVAYHPTPPIRGLPRPLQAVLDRALAKEPGKRFETAQALAEAFRAAIDRACGPQRLATGRMRGPLVAASKPAQTQETEPLAGVKGGHVAARPALAPRRTGWIWALPALALLLLAPLAFNQYAPSRDSTTSRVASKPAASQPTARPGAHLQPGPVARVEVNELTPRREPPRSSRARPAAAPAPVRRAAAGKEDRTEPSRAARTRRVARHDTTVDRRRTARPSLQTAAQGAVKAPAGTSRRTVERSRPQVVAAERRARQLRSTARVIATAPPRPERTVRRTIAVAGRREERRAVTRVQPVRSARSARALDAQGYRLLRRGRPSDAEPLLREAVRRNPNYAYAQYNLGWSLLQQGKAREALGPLQRTAAQQPRRWEPQHRLAQAYERLGRHDQARAAYARARALRSGRRSSSGRTARRGESQPRVRQEERASSGEGDRRPGLQAAR